LAIPPPIIYHRAMLLHGYQDPSRGIFIVTLFVNLKLKTTQMITQLQ
jgi:hypothetical protein